MIACRLLKLLGRHLAGPMTDDRDDESIWLSHKAYGRAARDGT
jgi:hypothetical protein